MDFKFLAMLVVAVALGAGAVLLATGIQIPGDLRAAYLGSCAKRADVPTCTCVAVAVEYELPQALSAMYMRSTAQNIDMKSYARENGLSESDVRTTEAAVSRGLDTCEQLVPRPSGLPVTQTATRPSKDDYLQFCGPDKPRCRCFADAGEPLPPDLRLVYFLTMMDPAAMHRRATEAPLTRAQKDRLDAVVLPAIGRCAAL